MDAYRWQDDPTLEAFVHTAAADPDTLGLLLSGSRGAGVVAADSDYDLVWIVGDTAFDRRVERGEPAEARLSGDGRAALVELTYTCPRRLVELAANPSWRTAGYAYSTVVLDKTGQVADLVRAIATRPEEAARADVAGWFDSYLNAFYRSLKAWRRGDELGGRLQAAESVTALVRTLFALERRWPPYHDRLMRQLDALELQGWPAGYLREALLDVLRTGDPAVQKELEARVEALLRTRGFGSVIDAWGEEIERVRAQF
jgi:Domain of unknown function (DUF4037)